jgi:hypothetical protein
MWLGAASRQLSRGPSEQLAVSLADFSPAKRRQLYDCVTLQVMCEVEDALRSPPSSPLTIQRVYRLPHALIAAGEDLAHSYTAACDATAAAFPGRPVPDPWGEGAEGEMVAALARAEQLIERRVVAQWGVPAGEAAVLASIAFAELRDWVAHVFEEGRNARWTAPPGDVSQPNIARAKPRRVLRGKTTDERLLELVGTDEGRHAALAARNMTAVGRLIDRSHGAVGASPVWKKQIKPLRDAGRAYAMAARQERDAERRY